MLSKEELISLGKEGKIPGPHENEDEFLKRLNLIEKLKDQEIEGRVIEPCTLDCMAIYGADPKWIPLTYSNHGLLPWQGAALFVFGGKIPLIQLRKGFKRGSFLFYSRDEVLRHEVLHAMRVAFDEPRFEEILAYSHARSKWRRVVGPLFRTPGQTLFFLGILMLSLLLQGSGFYFIDSPFFPFFQAASILPLLDLAIRFGKLWRDLRILKQTKKKLTQIFPNQKNLFPILLRLKDAEIENFARDPLHKTLDYLEKKIPDSVRIRQILAQFG